MIEDLLDYVWVSDVSDNAHGATTQGAGGNIDIEDSSESFSPSQGCIKLTQIWKFFRCFKFVIPFFHFFNRSVALRNNELLHP